MWIFKFSPMYCLCEAVINIPSIDIFISMDEKEYKELSIPVAGGAVIFLGIQTIVYTILAILCELKAFTFWLWFIKRPI